MLIDCEPIIEKLNSPDLNVGAILGEHARRFASREFPADEHAAAQQALEAFVRNSEQARRMFDYAGLATAVDQLWAEDRRLRQPSASTPSSQMSIQAAKTGLFRRASQNGWASIETEALLRTATADASAIGDIAWDHAMVNGRRVDRRALRESLRTPAYSDDGFECFLSDLPRIEAPQN